MYKKFFKRLIDIVVSLLAMPFVALVLMIFAPIIYFTDKGPVFYNADRLGKDGKIFKMFKLRSMRVNSPNLLNPDGSTYNGDDDPRVTAVGRFIRKTSIDELPQFLNVLIGDMSLIGPRAHLTKSFKSFELLDEIRQRRLYVRPGITGYNQAYFRNSVTSEQKLLNDVYYVDNLSFALDVKILFKTIFSVLKRENIYVSTPVESVIEVSEKETVGADK